MAAETALGGGGGVVVRAVRTARRRRLPSSQALWGPWLRAARGCAPRAGTPRCQCRGSHAASGSQHSHGVKRHVRGVGGLGLHPRYVAQRPALRFGGNRRRTQDHSGLRGMRQARCGGPALPEIAASRSALVLTSLKAGLSTFSQHPLSRLLRLRESRSVRVGRDRAHVVVVLATVKAPHIGARRGAGHPFAADDGHTTAPVPRIGVIFDACNDRGCRHVGTA